MATTVTCDLGSLTYTLYGGTLLQATLKDQELLFLSEFSKHPQSPVRGGIPICWPWFGVDVRGRHGTVRDQPWKLDKEEITKQSIFIKLSTTYESLTVSVTFELSNTLKVMLFTTNTGQTFPRFSAALHTYFKAAKPFSAAGLGSSYQDKVLSQSVENSPSTDINFAETVDRIYQNFDSEITFQNIKLTPISADSVIYWNPGKDAAGMADLKSCEGFACVEAGLLKHGDLLSGEAIQFGFQVELL